MTGQLMRGAVGCVIACGAAIVGPAIVGTAVAKADLAGVGGSDINVLGIARLGSGSSGSGKSRVATGRDASLVAVSTAPSARSVVIRATFPAAQADSTTYPASVDAVGEAAAAGLGTPIVEAVPAAPQTPPAAPLSVPPPAAPIVYGPPPQAVPAPSTVQPGPVHGVAPAEPFSPPAEIPDSFRVGYADYLRSATMGDLFAAALPGVAGIAGFTLAGAYVGYRQARAVQAALLAPVPTRVLL
jgi:hypothetical protein